MATNRYPAPCLVCSNIVPARGGERQRFGDKWIVTHLACKDGNPQAFGITLNSGAQLSVNRNGRCEDAPCCGCCT